ncbi:unnamed protein product [Ixodes persulcatus]
MRMRRERLTGRVRLRRLGKRKEERRVRKGVARRKLATFFLSGRRRICRSAFERKRDQLLPL